MKISRSQMNHLALVLAALLLFESCGAYRSENITIDTAVEEGSKVKVRTNEGEKIKFRRIIKEDNTYYGIKKSGKTIPVSENNLQSIRLFNKTGAIILNVLAFTFIVGFVLSTIVVVEFNNAVTK
ncbi:MAG: hypothetical protein AAF688_09005 [Bacteroidota bacterium]